MYENGIKEPENIFDAALVPIYTRSFSINGLNRNEMLKEIVRVTKPKAPVILVCYYKRDQDLSPPSDIIEYLFSVFPQIFTDEIFE